MNLSTALPFGHSLASKEYTTGESRMFVYPKKYLFSIHFVMRIFLFIAALGFLWFYFHMTFPAPTPSRLDSPPSDAGLSSLTGSPTVSSTRHVKMQLLVPDTISVGRLPSDASQEASDKASQDVNTLKLRTDVLQTETRRPSVEDGNTEARRTTQQFSSTVDEQHRNNGTGPFTFSSAVVKDSERPYFDTTVFATTVNTAITPLRRLIYALSATLAPTDASSPSSTVSSSAPSTSMSPSLLSSPSSSSSSLLVPPFSGASSVSVETKEGNTNQLALESVLEKDLGVSRHVANETEPTPNSSRLSRSIKAAIKAIKAAGKAR